MVPHALVVRIPGFHPGSPGFIPVWEDNGIAHCAWFGALQDKGDAGLLELPAPGLEHGADLGLFSLGRR